MERTGQSEPGLETMRSLEASRVGEDLTAPIGALVSGTPLAVSSEETVSGAARAMREAGTSYALVSGDPPGILTDTDLRSRVLAEGLGPDTTVRAVMSSPLETFPAETPIFDVLRRVLELDVHHVPVTRGGQVVAILTDTELLRHRAKSPLLLLSRIEQLERVADAPVDYSSEVAGVAERLFDGGLGVAQIARVLAAVNDALVARLLTLAERELGPPPCPYAWMVLGSEGRMEQVLLTDQDNALVYLSDADGAETYFEALARRVVDGIVQTGFPPCPGGYMATRWCRPLRDWRALFRKWVEVPEPRALLEAQVFLDFRAVHGPLSLAPLDEALRSGGSRGLFLHQMARASLAFRPPVGRFGRVRTDGGAIDLKVAGIAAAVMLARTYALAARSGARPTLERLDAAAAAGTLSRSSAEVLGESFRFLTRLRLEEQLRAVRAGEPPTNRVVVEALSPLERRRLKEALQAIRRLQDATAVRFRTGELA
jgi:CBS domain-containing protein